MLPVTEMEGVTSLDDIRECSKEYADTRDILVQRVQHLNDELESTKRRLLPGIRNAVQLASTAKAALVAMVDQARGLFTKPRTHILHGIKIGLQKNKDGLVWDNDDMVVKAIKKHLPDQVDALIKVVEKPVKDALVNLPVADLRKIGVRLEPGADTVVVKPVDSDVDKLVAALLKDNEQNQVVDDSAGRGCGVEVVN
jgi:hypothetical protein